jgi:hypothetical protein
MYSTGTKKKPKYCSQKNKQIHNVDICMTVNINVIIVYLITTIGIFKFNVLQRTAEFTVDKV